MARTIAIVTPESAHFPTTNFAALSMLNQRPVLAYDASTEETAYWTIPSIQGLTTPLTLVITYVMASATANAVVLGAQIEAITDGDATDIGNTTSFDTTNNSASTTVPGTAGYIDQISITLTNNDSIAVGDYARLLIARKTADGGDTATGDLYLLYAELRDAA